MKPGDRVQITKDGGAWGKGTVYEVHYIKGRISSVRVMRDAGTQLVLRPAEIRKIGRA